MIQQTSLNCYLELLNNNVVLAQSQQIVYNLIKQHNNITDSEISVLLGWGINRVTPRRYELVKANKVVQDTIRECLCNLCNNNLAKGINPVHRRSIAWMVI